MELVEAANLVLLLFVDVVALLDLDLIGDDQVLLVVLFSQGLVFLLSKQFDLTLGVELIDLDSCDLVHDVLQLHLFLLNVVSYFVGLFEEVACCFLDGRVLALLVDQTLI